METLRLLVQNLIIIVVLAVLLEMLLPSGEMRRYTRMVMGLMVIVAIVQAVSGITGGGLFREIEEYSWRSAPPNQGKGFDILEQGRRLDQDNRKQALEQYRKGVERQISALVGVDGKVRLAGADLNIEDDPSKKDFGRIREVKLRLVMEEGVKAVEPVTVMTDKNKAGPAQGGEPPPELAQEAAKATRIVANFYNIPQEQVKVKFGN